MCNATKNAPTYLAFNGYVLFEMTFNRFTVHKNPFCKSLGRPSDAVYHPHCKLWFEIERVNCACLSRPSRPSLNIDQNK